MKRKSCSGQCQPCLESHQYLLVEEETYEPPEDPDSGTSIAYRKSHLLMRV